MRRIIYLLFVLFFPLLSFGQNERVSENEVQNETRFLEALQHSLLEKWDEALEAFKMLEQENPGNDVISYEIARVYLKKGEDNNAIQYAEKAVNENPQKQIYREFLIDLLSSQRDYAALNQQLNYMIDSGSFNENYYYRLASGYERLANFKDALKILKELEEKIGYTKRLGKAYIRNYQKQKSNKKLKKELFRFTDNFPGQVDVLVQKAILLDSMGDEKEALAVYKEILTYRPDHVGANMYINNHDKKQASEKKFFSAMDKLIANPGISMDDKIKQLIPYVPRIDKNNDLMEDMLSLLEKLQQMYPEEAKIHALHGDIYFNAGYANEAITHYEKTIELNKSVFLVWKQLMMALDNTLQFERLKERAEEAIDYYPNQAVSYYYVGKSCIELGQIKDGIDWLQEGIWMSSGKLKEEFLLMTAFAYALQNDDKKAIELFKTVDQDKLGRAHSFYHEVKGNLLYNDKAIEEAIKEWETSIKFNGRKDRLEKKIKKAEHEK